jgi:hypothetical protein
MAPAGESTLRPLSHCIRGEMNIPELTRVAPRQQVFWGWSGIFVRRSECVPSSSDLSEPRFALYILRPAFSFLAPRRFRRRLMLSEQRYSSGGA